MALGTKVLICSLSFFVLKVLPSLEENEAFSSANDELKSIQMVEGDSSSFHIEPVQAGQIILTAQV